MFCLSLLEGKRKVAEEDKENSGQVGGRKRSTREGSQIGLRNREERRRIRFQAGCWVGLNFVQGSLSSRACLLLIILVSEEILVSFRTLHRTPDLFLS